MRFHYDTSLSPGGASAPSVFPCGAIRTSLGLFVVAPMGDVIHVSALARRGMR
jgi:hypothetical protein